MQARCQAAIAASVSMLTPQRQEHGRRSRLFLLYGPQRTAEGFLGVSVETGWRHPVPRRWQSTL